jgi:hypothetical protein
MPENSDLSIEEARLLVMEASQTSRYSLAAALAKSADPLTGGVSPSLIANVLTVWETEPWPRTSQPTKPESELFRPYSEWRKDDGNVYRSWMPSDLAADDEEPLRTFANTTRNVVVRVRGFEVLWSRFRRFPDAAASAKARLEYAELISVEDKWPDFVRNLGRLITLTLSVNSQEHVQPLIDLLERSARALRSSGRPFSFTVLADIVAHTLLARKKTRERFFSIDRLAGWIQLLEEIVAMYRGDPHHGHDALMTLQSWHTRLGNQTLARDVQERVIENLRKAARSSAAPLSLVQRALQFAVNFGHVALAQQLRLELMQAVQAQIPRLRTVRMPISIPVEFLAHIDRLATTNTLSSTLRQLAVTPGLLSVDADSIRAAAQEQLKEALFLGLGPSDNLHPDGKVTFRSEGMDGNVEMHMARMIHFHLTMLEGALAYLLQQTASKFDPHTLVDALAEWPHLPAHRRTLLTVAAERFAAQDWAASGFILLPLYEAVLRDLLRAGGHAAIKFEPGGILADETLNSLLRSTPVRNLLGLHHCQLVEFILCNPGLGWNLRNEVAHGTIRPEALTAPRLLVVWLLVIHLTCFVAGPASTDGDVPESSRPPETDADVDDGGR